VAELRNGRGLTAPPRVIIETTKVDPTGARRRGERASRPIEIRNGLPDFKPYVYRGTGTDQKPWAVASDD
jgi:hypothetical protein